MAFAKPEYSVKADKEIKIATNDIKLSAKNKAVKVKGTVIDNKGNPMTGASVVLQGTTTGTVVDRDGTFSIEVPEDKEWAFVVSYVGYKTILNQVTVSKDEKDFKFKFVLQREVISISSLDLMNEGDVPPPPAPPAPEFDEKSDKPVFYIVEDMPQYKQGSYGLAQYIKKQKRKLQKEIGSKLSGNATVGFTVTKKGEVSNIQILDKSNDIAAKAATKIANGMENWKPGAQRGKAVPVDFAMELEF